MRPTAGQQAAPAIPHETMHQSQPTDIVLLTGATGFIGSALIERLAARYTVVALDRPGPPEPAQPAHAIAFDLGSDEGASKALAQVRERFGSRIASVIHLAAYYDITGEPNPLYEKVNVQGSRRLIDALQAFELEQFVYASTMLVHRPTDSPQERIAEASPIEPAWPYPESKARTEAMLRERHERIPLVLLRIAGVYDDSGHSPFLAEQIARIHEHRLISHLYPGMLCAGQSFIHVEDLCDAIARLVERRHALPAEMAMLLGEPEALGYAEIQDIVGEALHGEGWRTLRVPQPLAKAGTWLQNEVIGGDSAIKPWMVDQASDHYVLDIGKARRLLGWEPKRSLRDTLPKMVTALRQDPTGWYRTNKLNAALVAWYGQRRKPSHDAPSLPPGAHHAHAPEGHGGEAGHAPGLLPAGGDMHGGHDHMAQMAEDERRTRWAHYANIGLGLWLASSPLFYSVGDNIGPLAQAVTQERDLPALAWRAQALTISDVASGMLIAFFGALSLSRRTAWFGQWAVACVGIWLLFAPLVFWSPSAAQYHHDVLVGAFAIAFSVLVPMMPGMSMEGMMDPKVVPPGWSYCPSTGAQRLPIAALGLVGLLISLMLTAYQLGHVGAVWEPFFAGSPQDPRNGTEEIITSAVSRAWPIPDAGLGAVSYMMEILMAVMGSRARWRTMPWMVTFFGILVVPLGVISIYFIIIQPILIGTWSTPALIAAAAMLVMIPFALDEVIAMGQYLYWAHCRGKPLLQTFLRGGAVDGGEADGTDTMATPRQSWRDMTRGVTLPPTLAASVVLGAFLMFSRVLLASAGAMANGDHVVGALVVTVAIIATAEVARLLRFVNVLFGAWLLVAPWVLDGASSIGTFASVAVGVALIGLSLPRGRRSREHYAGWDRFVV